MTTARQAANQDGWYNLVFGLWVFTDYFKMNEYQRPAYWEGTARDLCLSQGIAFDECPPQTH